MLQGDCQIPVLGAKGQDLAIPGERVTVGLLLPQCTSGSFGMNISISYVTQSLSFFGNFLVIGVRGRIRRI